MLRSMTGFAKIEREVREGRLIGEARSLNNRYLEVNIKIPKSDYFLEQKLRELVKKYLRRGRVDISFKLERSTDSHLKVKINEEVVAQYISLVKEIKKRFKLRNSLSLEALLSFKDVIQYEELSPLSEESIFEAFEEILKELDRERRKEGSMIEKELTERLDEMVRILREIEEHVPDAMLSWKERLRGKLKELKETVEEEKLMKEAIFYMEKFDISEEISRLKSHIQNFRLSLREDLPLGRKLEFISQEMLREANTMGSKSPDYFVSERVVLLKVEIERIREQIQNVE